MKVKVGWGTQWGAVIGGPHGVTSVAVLIRSVLFSYIPTHTPESESESRKRYTTGCCNRGSSWGNFCDSVDTICSILLYSDPHAWKWKWKLWGTQWGAVVGGPHGVTSVAVLILSVLFSYTLIHMPESERESRMRYTMGCLVRFPIREFLLYSLLSLECELVPRVLGTFSSFFKICRKWLFLLEEKFAII